MKRKPLSFVVGHLFVAKLKPEYQMNALPGTYINQYCFHYGRIARIILTHRARLIGGL